MDNESHALAHIQRFKQAIEVAALFDIPIGAGATLI
jgi:hypothetical protein